MSSSISSFLKSVPVAHLCLERPFPSWWIFIQFGGGSRKVSVLQEGITLEWLLLVFPLLRTRGSRVPFQLPSSFRHTSFRQIVHSCIFRGGPKLINLQFIQQACACLSHFFFSTLFVVDLHVISWHFVLTWPLSLSLSRRGVLWRSCARGTGFCAVVVVVVWECQGQMLMATRPGGVPCREVRQVLL